MAILSNQNIAVELCAQGAAISKLYFQTTCIAENGITVGRFANRIGGGNLPIGGRTYHLLTNENRNTLHGGPNGFSKRMWDETLEFDGRGNLSAVTFRLRSENGDQGFPGNLVAQVRYQLTDTALEISYKAFSDRDTVISLTNHAYFNLNGLDGKDCLNTHELMIVADQILETDKALVPTGKLLAVDGTPFDFRIPKIYQQNYDHSFVLQSSPTKPCAILTGLNSGLQMKVYTDCPCMQLYNTDTQICLETQQFPDSENHPGFPSAVLLANQVYQSKTVYQFSSEQAD